nr:MAG TPA: hypothetical protein [Caudoviricetes sp.]
MILASGAADLLTRVSRAVVIISLITSGHSGISTILTVYFMVFVLPSFFCVYYLICAWEEQ